MYGEICEAKEREEEKQRKNFDFKGSSRKELDNEMAKSVNLARLLRHRVTEERQKEGKERGAHTSPQATSPVTGKGAIVATDQVFDNVAGAMTAAEENFEEKTRQAKKHSGGLKLFSGNGNLALALEIARYLGISLGKATVGRFADGEVNVVVHENVRGKDVFVIQPTCPPVNDNIMELLLMVSTLNRASARRITVVIPYYGYARQDRKMQVSSLLTSCWCFHTRSVLDLIGIVSDNLLVAFYLACEGTCPHLSCGRCPPSRVHGDRPCDCGRPTLCPDSGFLWTSSAGGQFGWRYCRIGLFWVKGFAQPSRGQSRRWRCVSSQKIQGRSSSQV